MISRVVHFVIWAFTFPLVGLLIWGLLFGIAGAIVRDGGPERMKTAGNLEGFAAVTGMLLALVLAVAGGVVSWVWPSLGLGSALGYLILSLLGLALISGILLWLLGVPRWTLV